MKRCQKKNHGNLCLRALLFFFSWIQSGMMARWDLKKMRKKVDKRGKKIDWEISYGCYTLADDENRDSPPAMVARLWNCLRLRPFRGLLLEVLVLDGLSGSRVAVTSSDPWNRTWLGVSSPGENTVATAGPSLPPSFVCRRADSSPWSMLLFLGFSGWAGT